MSDHSNYSVLIRDHSSYCLATANRLKKSQDGAVMIIMSRKNLNLLIYVIKKLLFTFQLNSVARYKKTKTQNLFLNSRQEICKVGLSK